MSDELRARARTFLDRPIPETAAFVLDSVAENLLTRYSASGSVGKKADELELCAFEAEQAAAAARGRRDEEAAYFADCASILRAIRTEAFSGADER